MFELEMERLLACLLYTSSGDYTTTTYRGTQAIGSDIIQLRFTGMGFHGNDLIIPYTCLLYTSS